MSIPQNQLPVPDVEPAPDAPTVMSLAAAVAALTRRLALLEVRLGVIDDTTLADLPEHEAIALVGGPSARLDRALANAKALAAAPVPVSKGNQ